MTVDAYHLANHKSKNWQDLYLNYYGMTESEMIKAGSLWTEYQLKNSTPVELFSGIKQTVNRLSVPQGICSQNSADNILQVLIKYNLSKKFEAIIGYDDVPSNAQKPSPVGGITCLRKIFGKIKDKTIAYIGDHEGDVEFARNIENNLSNDNKIISIAATYSGADTKLWTFKPDYEIASPSELLKLLTEN